MQENEDQLEPLFAIGLDDSSKQSMRTVALWAMVTGVTGFISLLLMSISNLNTLTTLAKMSAYLPASTYFAWYLLGTILFTVLCFLINYFLLRFGARTKQGIELEEGEVIAEGIKHLNSYTKVLGISTIIIIMIVLYIVLQALSH